MRDFREALLRLQDMVSTIAKKDFNNDLAALIESLGPHDKKDLAAFVFACQKALEAPPPQDPDGTAHCYFYRPFLNPAVCGAP